VNHSESPAVVTRSPLLGEHNEEVLSQVLGYTPDEVAAIQRSGALGSADAKAAAAE
jgi:formyl-CoA transferase